jgi:PEP-CTERM/exosortase A-associated glycosyltransferase
MRILHVLHTSLPYSCGYSLRSDRILQRQLADGCLPGVVTSAQQPEPNRAELRDGIRYWRTLSGRMLPTPLREFQLMKGLAGAIDAATREFQPDVIHAHSPILVGLPAWCVARRHRIPFVYEIRDLWENASVDHGKFAAGSLPYRAARTAETFLLRRADAVVTIGDLLRAELQARTSVPVTVAANGVDLNAFRPLTADAAWLREWNPDGMEIVAYVGSFQPYEGLEILIEAMALLRQARPRAKLLIVGDGPNRKELEDAAKRLNLGPRIHFAGRVPHARVREIYAVASVLVYPRLDTLTTRLTTPLKPLEAMAMQRAVVVSDLPALRELIQDGVTGLLFPAGDAQALAGRLERLLASPQEQQRLVAGASDWVRAHRSWDATLAGYAPLYRRLLI